MTVKNEEQLTPGKLFIRQDLITKYCFILSNKHCLYYDVCRSLKIRSHFVYTNHHNEKYVIVSAPSMSLFHLNTAISA